MAYSAKTDWKLADTVQPEDMNRIEGGIKTVDSNKANAALDNVTGSSFSNKAKLSGLEVPATGTVITYYVAVDGDDTSGTGTSSKPFKTIQRAVDAFSHSNPKGTKYIIVPKAGTHAGFSLKCSKQISIQPESGAVIGKIMLEAGVAEITGDVSINDSINIYQGASFKVNNATMTKGTSSSTAISCQDGATLVVKGEIILNDFSFGVSCVRGTAYINKITMLAGTTGVSCECGQVHLGAESISAATKYAIRNGGRIFVGSETISE